MRLHFQEKPWDLAVAVGYVVVTTASLFAIGVGNLFAILLVLFVPGYVLVAALFPNGQEIDWVERVALSFGLSIAVVPLLGLLLNFTPWGIRFAPILTTIALFSIGVGYAAYRRRMLLPPERRLSFTVDLPPPGSMEYGGLDKVLSVALAASIVAAMGVLAYVATRPEIGERFTEFYILGPGGNASGYPTNLTPTEPATLIIGIINHEAAAVNYSVRVDLVGVNAAFNTSCNCNQTQEVNRTSISWLNQSLDDNQNWTHRYTFWINATGLWKLQFLLFKGGILTTPELHLFIRVS